MAIVDREPTEQLLTYEEFTEQQKVNPNLANMTYEQYTRMYGNRNGNKTFR